MADQQSVDGGSAKTPADFLKSIKGKPVVVKLNSGVDYRGKTVCGACFQIGYLWRGCGIRRYVLLAVFLAGILACLDGYMNIAMEQTEVCFLVHL